MLLHYPGQIALSTYDLIMDFAFSIMALIHRKKEAFFVSSYSWGFDVSFCQGFWKATGTATVDFLAQFLSVF